MIEIIEFDPRRVVPAAVSSPPSPLDIPRRLDVLSLLRLQYRAATSVVAALAVLALHVMVLAPVLWGGSATHEAARFGAPTPIQAMLIDDRSASAITSLALSPPLLRHVSVNLPEVPDRKRADPGLAVLYGRYLGQIHARIDRAWLRPSALTEPDPSSLARTDPRRAQQSVSARRAAVPYGWR